jgi:hypothetical protein
MSTFLAPDEAYRSAEKQFRPSVGFQGGESMWQKRIEGQMPRRHCARSLAAAVFLVCAALMPNRAGAAPDNILGALGDPVRMLHMFSAADGTTRMEEITLPLRSDEGGITRTFLAGRAENLRLHTYRNGFNSPWRYAQSEGSKNTGHVVLLLQGELVITIAEGKSYRVPAGTLMFNEDRAGRGHQTRCENATGKDCVILQMDLEDAARQLIFPTR